jgi:Fic family protein
MYITNSHILDEIAKKLEILKRNPRSHILNGNCTKSCINHETINHSLRIEEPRSTPRRSHSGKEQSKLYNHMLSAFYWGRANMELGNLTEAFIQELAAKIDPVQHKKVLATYREVTEAVRPSGATWTPVYPDKIPLDMGRLIIQLNDLSSPANVKSVVDVSSYAHLHLVRVHPFSDTNGRTSRMLQNLILDKLGIPSAPVYEGERFGYFHLLDDAINGWRERTGDKLQIASQGEKRFYDFMGGKISSTLDRVIDNL